MDRQHWIHKIDSEDKQFFFKNRCVIRAIISPNTINRNNPGSSPCKINRKKVDSEKIWWQPIQINKRCYRLDWFIHSQSSLLNIYISRCILLRQVICTVSIYPANIVKSYYRYHSESERSSCPISDNVC